MGSIMSEIYEDIRYYKYLCNKYNEEPVMMSVRYEVDPYSDHAKSLMQRDKEEQQNEV